MFNTFRLESSLGVEAYASLELLVGLPNVGVLGVDDVPDGSVRIHVEIRESRPVCLEGGGRMVVTDQCSGTP